MNKLLSFTGGKPDFNIDDMLWNEEATRDGLNDVFRAFGDNYIIYGVTGTTSITAGYIMLDGELIKVDAHSKTDTHFVKVITYAAGGDATFNDGVARQTWQQNRATISASSGSLAYATAERLADKIVTLTGGVYNLVLDIGDWDMDADSTVSVAHGLTYSKIRGITSVAIRNDADTGVAQLQVETPGTLAGSARYDATNIILTRLAGSAFDSVNYDSTSYNRGWILIQYIP